MQFKINLNEYIHTYTPLNTFKIKFYNKKSTEGTSQVKKKQLH